MLIIASRGDDVLLCGMRRYSADPRRMRPAVGKDWRCGIASDVVSLEAAVICSRKHNVDLTFVKRNMFWLVVTRPPNSYAIC